jgi:type I restriction enzyme, S subunit
VSELPKGWEATTIGEVTNTSLGKMLDRKRATGDHPTPYLRNINVRWGTFELNDLASMDIRPEELDRVLAAPGDVIACEGGEPGRAAVWRGPGTIALQKALHRIRPTLAVEPRYLTGLLHHLALSRSLDAFFTGTTIKHLPQEKLRLVPVPLPPRREQERIVTAIEEQFSRLDQAEQLLRSARRRADHMRSSVLAAVTPAEGKWTTLGDIAEIVGGVTKDTKRQLDPSFVDVPYLRVANVQRGYLNLSDVTTIRVPPDKAKALALEGGDILFNEGGDRDKLGRGWVWQGEIDHCIHQNHVFRARLLNEQFDPKYVSMHGNTFGQQWFERMGKQTTNLASINLRTLRTFPVPELPVEDQRRIVAEVERQLTVIDSLSSVVDNALVRSDHLRRAILDRAFSGLLVPQDPTDEPASALLARASSTLTTPTSRRRKRT